MSLDVKFREAFDAYLAADRHKTATIEAFAALIPPVPADLVCARKNGFYSGLTREERDLEGNTIYQPHGFARRIYDSDRIREAHGRWFNHSSGREFKALFRRAKKYEDAKERALVATGIKAAVQEREFAIDDVRRAFYDICDADAWTVTGLIAKANAKTCFASIGKETKFFSSYGGDKLAVDILRVMGKLA
ncbi:MAG: hypothetical protein EOR67_16180 [Mesorhizobium sp.]|uniref:hypothetical protein n=1 Tax=Mesorhizobium sp. TaxID=1871066 RepID=UPI000FEA09FA|nr:hypothetical protein [Mesorhizobium sp.]RWL87735.1 MAG: hypothetical protein EOR67_16180 [Mesorhizobium sp.]